MASTWQAIIPVRNLIELVNPFVGDVWVIGGVGQEDVAVALDEERLSDVNPSWTFEGVVNATAQDHAERIAWLITYGWDPNEPLSVEVDVKGVVTLGDGNHRLHALAYLDADVDVLVDIYGCIEVVEAVFDICLEEAG